MDLDWKSWTPRSPRTPGHDNTLVPPSNASPSSPSIGQTLESCLKHWVLRGHDLLPRTVTPDSLMLPAGVHDALAPPPRLGRWKNKVAQYCGKRVNGFAGTALGRLWDGLPRHHASHLKGLDAGSGAGLVTPGLQEFCPSTQDLRGRDSHVRTTAVASLDRRPRPRPSQSLLQQLTSSWGMRNTARMSGSLDGV